jgi:hypothetical protein
MSFCDHSSEIPYNAGFLTRLATVSLSRRVKLGNTETYDVIQGNKNCSSLERTSAAALINLEPHFDASSSPESKWLLRNFDVSIRTTFLVRSTAMTVPPREWSTWECGTKIKADCNIFILTKILYY